MLVAELLAGSTHVITFVRGFQLSVQILAQRVIGAEESKIYDRVA